LAMGAAWRGCGRPRGGNVWLQEVQQFTFINTGGWGEPGRILGEDQTAIARRAVVVREKGGENGATIFYFLKKRLGVLSEKGSGGQEERGRRQS